LAKEVPIELHPERLQASLSQCATSSADFFSTLHQDVGLASHIVLGVQLWGELFYYDWKSILLQLCDRRVLLAPTTSRVLRKVPKRASFFVSRNDFVVVHCEDNAARNQDCERANQRCKKLVHEWPQSVGNKRLAFQRLETRRQFAFARAYFKTIKIDQTIIV
jgi:hypothetical protein